MARPVRTPANPGHERRLRALLSELGTDVRIARLARGATQAHVAGLAGVGRSTVGALERGGGARLSLDTWHRVAMAAGRPLTVGLMRDGAGITTDAGHLAIQELVIRSTGGAWEGAFEMSVPGSRGRQSTDVVLRHRVSRTVALIECWNTIEDLGASVRSSAWKAARATEAAIAHMRPGDPLPPPVRSCWVIRSSRRNTEMLRRYPAVLAARFPGSSLGWVRALAEGTEPPAGAGLVWCDVGASRLYPWRPRP